MSGAEGVVERIALAETPQSLVYMKDADCAEHNAFISGFAYGRMTDLDSEMALHWWMRGYERDPYCHGEPENLLARIAQLEKELAGARDGVFELMDALGAMSGGDWELEGWSISEERCRELRNIAKGQSSHA